MTLRPLFVTGSLAHGGAERHSITLMNRLAERGHHCHAVYVKDNNSQLERIRQGEESSVLCLHASGFFDRQAVNRFAAHIDRLRPSVIIAANGYALMYASLAQFHSGWQVPIVATFHTTEVSGAREWLKMLVDRPFFWHAQHTVFVCQTQKDYWLRRGLGSRHNTVIHNGVDTEHFRNTVPLAECQALRQACGFANTDYVIGISAVLRPEKNHLQLVNAVAVLRSMGIPARVLIIGDGPLRAEVESHSRTLKVANSTHITGFVQDVRPYVASCDVMALCSLSIETFSLAALEAMSMGKPVIHSDVGGAAEMIIPGHNGYLFQAGNTGEFVHRLLELSEPKLAEKMGTAARELVERVFSESVMVDRYENLLMDTCASHPSMTKEAAKPNELIRPEETAEIQMKQEEKRHENA